MIKQAVRLAKRHHRSREEYVQVLETIDVEQQGSTTFLPEELRNAALQLSKARTLLDWTKARLEKMLVS